MKYWDGWITDGIKTAVRNINNLKYADDTNLMAESKEELKRPLMRMKEESEKAGRTQHSKTEDHGIAPISSVQLLSHVQLCDPKDCSMPGFPVHHQLLELAQTHVHRVGDVIQPYHPLSSPFPSAFNLFKHQCFVFFFPMSPFFASGGQSIGVWASA